MRIMLAVSPAIPGCWPWGVLARPAATPGDRGGDRGKGGKGGPGSCSRKLRRVA